MQRPRHLFHEFNSLKLMLKGIKSLLLALSRHAADDGIAVIAIRRPRSQPQCVVWLVSSALSGDRQDFAPGE